MPSTEIPYARILLILILGLICLLSMVLLAFFGPNPAIISLGSGAGGALFASYAEQAVQAHNSNSK